MEELQDLQHNIDIAKLPTGKTKDTPGLSCADLGKSQLYPGEYWIDPNQGYWSDALKVTCHLDESTSQIRSCLKVTYQDGRPLESLGTRLLSQLKLLRLNSVAIMQHFTIQCRDIQIHVGSIAKDTLKFLELKEEKIISHTNATNNCQRNTSVSEKFATYL